jgi:ribonuclease P protein component
LDEVFAKGKAFQSGPVRLLVIEADLKVNYPIQATFAVSKRNFKHAHDRNFIKRLFRECYRKQKFELYEAMANQKKQFAMVWIFQSKRIPDYAYLSEKVNQVLKQFIQTSYVANS